MMYDLIISNSLTYAHQGLFILTKAQIPAFVVRTPRSIGTFGCSYAIRVNSGMGRIAAKVLRENHFPHGRIFTLYPNGSIGEVLP